MLLILGSIPKSADPMVVYFFFIFYEYRGTVVPYLRYLTLLVLVP